ncbi:TetR/AcrR family transcriptional regulator [Fulvivirgaceae bacterium LMO-SS25]
MEVKEKIIEAASTLFMSYGVKSVTMDDIAKNLAVSKKTIYQEFADKNELVLLFAERHLLRYESEFHKIGNSANNAIEELYLTSLCLRKIVEETSPNVIYDLKKYHAKAWNHYLGYKESLFKDNVKKVIERGMKEGLFRDNIDSEVLSTVRIEEVQLCFNLDLFPKEKFSMAQVQIQVFQNFVLGLLTDKGRELWNSYLNEIKP